MKKTMKNIVAGGLIILASLCFTPIADALEVKLEPANAQREIGGKVRVHVYADGAQALISNGVKITFNKDVLQVNEASKGDAWTLEALNEEGVWTVYPTPNAEIQIDNANGTVSWIGGHIRGDSTVGLSGKVLLGWVVFEAIGNGNSNLHVDLGKYHPEDPSETFDNFVRLDTQTPDEPTNVPGDLGIICVMDGACTADMNGNGMVEGGDFARLRSAMPSSFPDSRYDVYADINANGMVEGGDFAILRSEMPKECPSCP